MLTNPLEGTIVVSFPFGAASHVLTDMRPRLNRKRGFASSGETAPGIEVMPEVEIVEKVVSKGVEEFAFHSMEQWNWIRSSDAAHIRLLHKLGII